MGTNELRPKNLKEYIGQKEIKENLEVSIKAAKLRKRQFPHTLFYGGAGLGKTTLSSIIAQEFGSKISFANAANMKTLADVISYIVNLEDGDFLFIDEIHRLKNDFEEMLYTVMEDFRFDFVTQKGSDTIPVSLSLPKFTLIGATTLKGNLTQPLIDRFGIKIELKDYEIDELMEIIKRSANILNIKLEDNAIRKIAICSRGTPRKANQILDRVIDFSVVDEIKCVSLSYLDKILEKLNIDEYGLDNADRHILRVLYEDFKCSPVGLNNLSATSGQQKDTLERTIEPYLLKNKLIVRTSRGRKITELGIKVITTSKV